jgi:hypothetical protein
MVQAASNTYWLGLLNLGGLSSRDFDLLILNDGRDGSGLDGGGHGVY